MYILKLSVQDNPLYCDIHIGVNNIPNELTEMTDTNPLHSYRFNSQETMFVHIIFSGQLRIAPGERKQPGVMLNDDYCEELDFLYLFLEGKFGYKRT